MAAFTHAQAAHANDLASAFPLQRYGLVAMPDGSDRMMPLDGPYVVYAHALAVFKHLVEALAAIEDGEGDADVIARQTLASIPNTFRTDAE